MSKFIFFLVVFLQLILISLQQYITPQNICTRSGDFSSADSLNRFQNSDNFGPSLDDAYCNVLSPTFRNALRAGVSDYEIPNLDQSQFSNLTNPLLLTFSDRTVELFSNEQIAAVMESKTSGLVAKADLLARNWRNADVEGVLDKSKTSSGIWSEKVIKSSILYQTSYYKMEGQSSGCFWDRSFRRENSFFDEDIRIQNIEGVTVEMIDTLSYCGVTFHLVAWGKLSQTTLEKPKCRRLISVSKEKGLTGITSRDNSVYSFQCMNLDDVKFDGLKTQVWRIRNVRYTNLPMFLGAEIFYQNIAYLDPQYTVNDLANFFKYTTIKELQVLLADYYVLRNYNSGLLIPYATNGKLFHQVFAAFNHVYQRGIIETLNFPELFSPEWIVRTLRQASITYEVKVPNLNPEVRLTTAQKRAFLFVKLSLKELSENGDGLPANGVETCDPILISGIPLEIFKKSSETIFKSSAAFSINTKLKSASSQMNYAQKLTVLDLCKDVLGDDCMTQNAFKIGLEFFDVMPLNEMQERLNSKPFGFSRGLSDLRVYKYPDGTFQINQRDLIEFDWSRHHLIAIMEKLKDEIGKPMIFKTESLESLGKLAMGILPKDVIRVPYMDSFDLIEAFTSRKLIDPSNVRIFAKLLQNSLDQLFAPRAWSFAVLPKIFLEVFDGLLLSQIPLEKWASLEIVPSIEGFVDSEDYKAKSAICRELVAKVAGSEYLPNMEMSKKSNIANFYLLFCRYELPLDQEEGLSQNDLDILQELICHVDHTVLLKTSSDLIKQNIHLFQACCLNLNQSSVLFDKFFTGELSLFYAELVVDQYRFLTSFGNSIFDVLGHRLEAKLNNSKDAVLELYQNLNTQSRVEVCSEVEGWSRDRFDKAVQQADKLAQEYLAEMTHRVSLPCFSSVSQASDTLSQSYVTGLANHISQIPPKYFSKWASDCEILNSLEFLGGKDLTIDQLLNLKPLVDNLFKDDSIYKSLAIPSYNRLGSLLQVYSPDELTKLLDFSDADTIYELGRQKFWSDDQKRTILEEYMAKTYGSKSDFGLINPVDLAILGNFICVSTVHELSLVETKTLLDSLQVLGGLDCLKNSQKSKILKKYLEYFNHKDLSPAQISYLGNIVSVFTDFAHPKRNNNNNNNDNNVAQFLLPNNINAFKESVFESISDEVLSEILSRSVSHSEPLSHYLTLPQLQVIKKRLKTKPNQEIAKTVRKLLTSGDDKHYKFQIFIPEENVDIFPESPDFYDDQDLPNREDNYIYEYQYSNVVYITLSSKHFNANLAVIFISIVIKLFT